MFKDKDKDMVKFDDRVIMDKDFAFKDFKDGPKDFAKDVFVHRRGNRFPLPP